jgi:ATP-dependent Clp protease ATP-binding subunit ClpC
MLELFTDGARTVMQLAGKEAAYYQKPSIDTGHVLLGLVVEDQGLAAHALRNLGLDSKAIRSTIERLVPKGAQPILAKLPMSQRTERTIELAREECRRLTHNNVGTEHLLLGLLRVNEGVAADALKSLQVSAHDLREEVLSILGREFD